MRTTTVEIDHRVQEYAESYFGLTQNRTSVVEDAVTFVQRAAQERSKYDYIIHDVFTGGAEPVDLFTAEFITGLRNLLKPDGVVAIVGFFLPRL